MSTEDLFKVLVGLLPVIKIEERPADKNKCRYMIGTKDTNIVIRASNIYVRVGGGYATIEDHIKQVGPFECIKIYKIMKG